MESDEFDEPEMTVEEAIAFADSILPGIPAPKGEEDPRWQAIFKVEDFINFHPVPQREAVWEFIVRWGSHPECGSRSD